MFAPRVIFPERIQRLLTQMKFNVEEGGGPQGRVGVFDGVGAEENGEERRGEK